MAPWKAEMMVLRRDDTKVLKKAVLTVGRRVESSGHLMVYKLE